MKLKQDRNYVYAKEEYYNALSRWDRFKLLMYVAMSGKFLVKENK